MTSPFADASVEITADFSRFDEEFGRGLRARIKAATSGASKDFDQLGAAAKRAGDTVTRNMRTAGDSVRTSLAGGARTASTDLDKIAVSARRVSTTVTVEMRRTAATTRTAFAGVADTGAKVFTLIGTSARNASRDIQAAFNPAAMRRLFDPLVTGARTAATQVQAALGGPALRGVFDGIVDASRLVSIRLATDLPAAAIRVRDTFTTALGSGPGGARGTLTGIATESTSTAGVVATAFAGIGAAIRTAFADISAGGVFDQIRGGSDQVTTDIDTDFDVMRGRVVSYFEDIGRQSTETSSRIVAAFTAAGLAVRGSLRTGNPFQLLMARAAAAGFAVQASMQGAGVSVRRSLAGAGASASRSFGEVGTSARLAGARVVAAMTAAGQRVRSAFRAPTNPFTLLVAQAGDAADRVVNKFLLTAVQVTHLVSPSDDPFTALVAFAIIAARRIRDQFRGVGLGIARDFRAPGDPFDQLVDDANDAIRKIGNEFQNLAARIHGDLGAGVPDPFNVITRQSASAARDIGSDFDGTGEEISRDVNPPGNPFDGLVNQSDRAARNIKSNMREAGRSIAGMFTVVAGAGALAGGLGILTGGMSAFAGAAAAAVAALSPMAGLLLALPAAGAAGGLAVGTLTVGLDGVDKALTNISKGKVKDLEKDLAKLAPPAKAFVLAIKDLGPAFNGLKMEVQGTLFAGLAGTLKSVAGNLMPTFRAGLTAMATVFNQVARDVGAFLSDVSTKSALRDIFATAASAMGSLGEAVVPAAKAVLGLVQAGGPGVERMANGLRVMAERFAEFVDKASKSGKIADWIDSGIVTAVEFGRILSNVGSIIGGIFKAGGTESNSFMVNLNRITGDMKEFVQSMQGQNALKSLFGSLRDLAAASMPVLKSLAVGIGTSIAPIIGDIAKGMGPGLTKGIDDLAKGFASLIPAAKPFGNTLGVIARVLGELGELLGPMLNDILVVAAPAIDEMLTSLMDALRPALKALQPLFKPLMETVAILGKGLVYTANIIIGILMPVIKLLAPILTWLFGKLNDLMTPGLEMLKSISEWFETLDWDKIGGAIGAFFTEVVPGWFSTLGGYISKYFTETLPGTFTGLGTTIMDAMTNFLSIVVTKGAEILAWYSSLPGRIISFIGDMAIRLYNKWIEITGSIYRAVLEKGGQAVEWFRALPGRVLDLISGLAGKMYGFWAGVLSSAYKAVTERGAQILDWFVRLLPDGIQRPLRGLIDRVKGIAGDIIGGLVRGFEAGKKRITDAVGRLAGLIPSGIKSLLDSHSDSKVMADIGADAVSGLESGLLSGVGRVRAAVDRLAAEVTRDIGAPQIGAPVIGAPVIGPAAVAAAASVMPVAVPVTPVVPVQRAAPSMAAPGAVSPATLTGSGAGLTVVNNISLPTGDPQAAAQATVNRIAASVLAGGG